MLVSRSGERQWDLGIALMRLRHRPDTMVHAEAFVKNMFNSAVTAVRTPSVALSGTRKPVVPLFIIRAGRASRPAYQPGNLLNRQ